MMNDGYVDWLALGPGGQGAGAQGHGGRPDQVHRRLAEAQDGEDRKAPLDTLYDAQTIKAIADSPDTFQRWAFEQGQGALAGAMLSELRFPRR